MVVSSSIKGTCLRNSATSCSSRAEVCEGLLNSRACAALNNSIASTCRTLFTTEKHLSAELAPMLTWSSWACEESMESTQQGVHNCLFRLTMEAAVYCGIMNPLLRPGLATRNGGNPLFPRTSWLILRSDMLPSSATAIARKSRARARGCP